MKKFARRNKLAFTAAAVVCAAVLLALIVLVGSVARITKEKNQKDRALQERGVALQEKGTALIEAQTSAGAAKDQLFLALLNSARAGRFSGQMGQRFDSLQALTEAAFIRPDKRLRDEATVTMALSDVRPGPSWHWELGEAVDESYRFSAIADAQGIITVRSVPDRRELGRIESGRQTQALFFSNDGRCLAQFASDDTWRVWHWVDSHEVLSERLKGSWAMAFSPDSRHIAIGQNDHVLRFSLTTGLEVNRLQARSSVSSFAYNGDNRKLAVGYAHSDITSIYDAVDGRNLADLPIGRVDHQVVAWHPDGIRLAVGSSNPRIQIWNVDAKLKVATLEGHVQQVTRLAFHPDGELLASEGWEGVCRIWQPSSGRQLMRFSGMGPLSFSRDGKWLGGVGIGEDRKLLEIASCPEYRTIVSSLGVGEGDYHGGDMSVDNRLFAVGMADGVRLWDRASWRELAFLPIGRTWNVIFQPDGGELITCGPEGLQRWPIQVTPQAPSEVRLGPPTKIVLPYPPTRACRSQDGRTLAVITAFGPLIVNLTTGSVESPLMQHGSGDNVALSPDGQWMASCGWHSDRARLWNVASGVMVKEWILGKQMAVCFTPDSRTLITCRSEGFGFWDVASFQSVRRLPSEGGGAVVHQVAFSPDGKLMAIALAPSVVHLLDAASARTVTKLEDPHGDRLSWIGFTPDGTQLLTVTNYAKAIHAWDLRAIRTRLKGMRLDWEWPEFPARGEAGNSRPTSAAPVRRVEVVAAESSSAP